MKTQRSKERPAAIFISSILLFICGILSVWLALPDLIPIFRFSGLIDVAIAVPLFLSGYLIFRVENSETGSFIAVGLGLIMMMVLLSTSTVNLALLLSGIIPLIAGILGLTTQKATRRIIWVRRIKGFWFEFSHNKIGLVGLTLLIIFAVVAVFQGPIAALSYPNPDQPDLADTYAMPGWIGIVDPSSARLPPTLNYTLSWTWTSLPQNVTIEQTGDFWKIHYNRTDGQKVLVVLNATFDYPYDPPERFFYRFSWGALPGLDNYGMSTAKYSLEINETSPNNKVYPIWDQHWWAYQVVPCFVLNPNQSQVPWNASFFGPPRYYPGGGDYENFFNDREYIWSQAKYDRPGYGIYQYYYGGEIPLWDSERAQEDVVYTTDSRYSTIRFGYRDYQSRDLTHALLSPSGKYTFQLYVNIVPTETKAACEVRISKFRIEIPGRRWGLLGTDYAGHDCWARLIYGAKTSLAVGLSSAVIATAIGLLVGIVAGFSGGLTDEVLMRTVDVLLCLPVLPLLMVLVTFFGRSIIYIILIIAIFGWQGLSRLIRSQILSIREAPFIDCAKASGGSDAYIMGKHLLPNVMPIAVADFILAVPGAILLEAALSFIGFGDPSAPTWGREYSIMQEMGNVFISGKGIIWWWFIPPGLAITILCVSFVFIGHAIDEIVNPRLRRRR